MTFHDHPIFLKSIDHIRTHLKRTDLNKLEQKVLERVIHSSGDFSIESLVKFSTYACRDGVSSLLLGAQIIVDTKMVQSAISPMVERTLKVPIQCVLDSSSKDPSTGSTRSAEGMINAWREVIENNISPPPIVVIGSAPTALNALLDLICQGAKMPSLIIGMPVGFVEVISSKERLISSQCNYITLLGNRGGAAVASAAINALLRASIE